ncbi:hypothetical protein LRAMOSA08983 [Lichtheimia ramosa]|uniref:F-box domain-containing protein n=1 Tax=Lichtheimia ramosa TaxID=688394 RepID=A0A077WGD5_9FUNG|nr:hypothetical protein LRAMOSA08983 [Lichtheimia ramosa]
MSHPTLNDSSQLPTLTASTEEYKDLAYNSTTKAQQSPESALSTLDLRSIALTKTANCDSALDNAKTMQQLSPTSALEYMREAMIYSEQGKQRHVIDICNQALRMVDPKDVHYGALQQTKMDAEQQQVKCIDFISQLPVDIVITTLIPMFITECDALDGCQPCPYLYVSRVWRDRVIQSVNGLYFYIENENEENTYPEVMKFAQHIKSLCIDRCAEGAWLCDLLRNNEFRSLEELFIRSFSSTCINDLIPSLESLSSTLEHLELNVAFGPSLPAAAILSACPNLVLLYTVGVNHADLSLLPKTPWNNLTELEITCSEEKITFDQIMAIWERFPSLEHLRLDPCTDIRSAILVTDYYPSMNNLDIKISSGADITYNEKGTPSDDIGITHLALDTNLAPFQQHMDVNSILKRYHNTLEQIILNMELDTKNTDIYSIQYPRLKRLYLNSPVWWIPRNAPMLQELAMTMEAVDMFVDHSAVFDTIPFHLQKLELRFPCDSSVDIERYLIGLAEHAQLKELNIQLHSPDTAGTVLDAICRLAQLQSLVIHVWTSWDSSHMEAFFGRLVQDCPHLASLGLKCKDPPSIDALDILKRLKYLQHFGIYIDWTNGNEAFWHAFENLSQIKSIRIYPEYPDNNPRIQHLIKQRPDISIITTTIKDPFEWPF